jgi:hypothetical protein
MGALAINGIEIFHVQYMAILTIFHVKERRGARDNNEIVTAPA